jgi:PEP-CTERM motif
MRFGKLLSGITLLLGGLCYSAQASPIFGTFNMTGTVTVTLTTISWTSDQGPGFAPDMFTLSAAAGSFVGENGQNGIANLNNGTEPVDTGFPPQLFITFDVLPGLPNLLINFVYSGDGGSADCGLPPAVGQTCTPLVPGGSPFTFKNDNPPSNIQSSAQWVFSGITSDGLSNWVGDFTSQFGTSFQNVLAAFAPGGPQFVTNSFSATITVTPIPEPESASMMGIGLGLVGLAGIARKITKRA